MESIGCCLTPFFQLTLLVKNTQYVEYKYHTERRAYCSSRFVGKFIGINYVSYNYSQ